MKNRKKFLTDRKIKQIKKKMIELGITQAEIARDLGVTLGAVCHVVNGIRKSKRIRKYLEKRLGVRLDGSR